MTLFKQFAAAATVASTIAAIPVEAQAQYYNRTPDYGYAPPQTYGYRPQPYGGYGNAAPLGGYGGFGGGFGGNAALGAAIGVLGGIAAGELQRKQQEDAARQHYRQERRHERHAPPGYGYTR